MYNPCIKKYILTTIVLLTVPFGYAEASKEIELIVYNFLESYNQLKGIEFAGGPYEISQYDVNAINNDPANLFLNYKYHDKEGIVGWPSDFSIIINGSYYFSSAKLGKLALISDAVEKDLIKYRIKKDSLPRLNKSFMDSSLIAVVHVDTNGHLLRKEGDIPAVNKVAACSEGNILVFYNETYQSSFFHSLLTATRNFRLFQLGNDDHWNTFGAMKEPNYVSLPMTNQFLLFGAIDDKHLLSLIRQHHQMYPGFEVLAVEINTDNQAILYEGDLIAVTKWLTSKPVGVAVFERKKEDWELSKTIEIINVDNYCVDFPIQLYPLTPELNDDQLTEIKKNVALNTQLDNSDIMKLIHYAYRLRGLSNNVLSINEIGPMEVNVRLGRGAFGSEIKFKKIEAKWLMTGYSEYIR